MIIYLPKLQYKNIILFDIEYDHNSLVQLAFIILGAKGPEVYEVKKSFNVYMKQSHSLSQFFTSYTNINDVYLRNNGLDLPRARALVEEVVFDIEVSDTLLVGHGMDNDMRLLDEYNICLSRFSNRYDTYKHAKKVLKRNQRLSLAEVAAEDCYFMFDEHNAYADVWGLLHAFSLLVELEGEQND